MLNKVMNAITNFKSIVSGIRNEPVQQSLPKLSAITAIEGACRPFLAGNLAESIRPALTKYGACILAQHNLAADQVAGIPCRGREMVASISLHGANTRSLACAITSNFRKGVDFHVHIEEDEADVQEVAAHLFKILTEDHWNRTFVVEPKHFFRVLRWIEQPEVQFQ